MGDELINVSDFERVAAEKLEPGVLGYFAGGAGDEQTLRENVPPGAGGGCARGRWQGSATGSTSAEILGGQVAAPILVAPVAYQALVDPEGEAAMARAAAAAGTVMCLSTLATMRPRRSPRRRPAAGAGFSSTGSVTWG